MPLILVPTPIDAVLTVAQRGTLWHRLQRLARRATAPLMTFWQTLFADGRRTLDANQIADALQAGHLLDAEQEVMGGWYQEVEPSAREFLPLVLWDIVRRTGTMAREAVEQVTEMPVPLQPVLEAARQEVETYAQRQVSAITQTTLLGVRHLLRGARATGASREDQVQQVHAGFGLTPQQIRSLARAQEHWQQEGRSATVIHDATQQAVLIGLARRVRAIAETQAFGAVNLGHRLAMTQAAQGSLGGGAHIRRYWHVQPGACPVCRQIPGLNPQGVGLGEPFSTPNGPLMDAPVHVSCRCMAEYRAGGIRP